MLSFKVTKKSFHYSRVYTPRFKGFFLDERLSIFYFIKDLKTGIVMPLLNKKQFLIGYLFDCRIIKDLANRIITK